MCIMTASQHWLLDEIQDFIDAKRSEDIQLVAMSSHPEIKEQKLELQEGTKVVQTHFLNLSIKKW